MQQNDSLVRGYLGGGERLGLEGRQSDGTLRWWQSEVIRAKMLEDSLYLLDGLRVA